MTDRIEAMVRQASDLLSEADALYTRAGQMEAHSVALGLFDRTAADSYGQRARFMRGAAKEKSARALQLQLDASALKEGVAA